MKRKLFNSLLVFVLSPMMFSSCIMYHPHNIIVPLLHEKGEVQVEASVSESAPLLVAPAVNVSAAYAPVNMLALQAGGSFTDEGNMFGQFAAGTFQTFGKSVLECYVGYGRGSSYSSNSNENNKTSHYVDGYYNLVFSQINFGWRDLAEGDIDVGFGLKGGLMTPKWDKVLVDADGVETLEERHEDAHFLLQPHLMFRFGIERFKFSINMAYAFLSDWPNDNSYFNYERFSLGLGVNFCF